MLAFGLLIAICFIPGYTGAMIPTQWAVLSAILPLGLFRLGNFGSCHWLGLLALAWAAFSIHWSPSYYDAVYGFWIACIWAGAFWFGGTISSHSSIYKGLALGLSTSSIVAIFQALGYSPVEIGEHMPPAGLLFNSTVLGASCALIIVALAQHRLWFWIPGLIPALYLSHSRAAIAIIVLAFLAKRVHFLVAIAVLVVANLALTFYLNPSDTQRLMLWGLAIRELSLFGHGIGSFADFFYYNSNSNLYIHSEGFFRTEFVHNDYLQLWFELGIGAIPIYVIFAIALYQTKSAEWPVFFAFAILSLFYFPLYTPITTFIGCLSAGRIIADWHRVRRRGGSWRSTRLSWNSSPRFFDDLRRPKAIPLASPT
jgi:hypothetical protein